MSFLMKWLGLSIDRSRGISVRPARTFEIDLPYNQAFERCGYGLQEIVGAQVRESDPQRGTIEATFGLMFSERLACSLQRIEDNRTQVSIESRRIAGTELPKDSTVLDRLEIWMREGR